MIYLVIILFLVFSIGYFIQKIASRLLLKLYFKKTIKKSNPYINYHQIKMSNDKNYNEYLEWLSKQDGEFPIDKLETPEDKKAKEKIRKLWE